MMEDPEPAQPADTTMGGTETILCDEDIMIDVKGFYSDNLGEGYEEFGLKNVDKGVSLTDINALTSPSTAMKIDDEQHLKVYDTSGVQKEIS